MLLVFVDDAKRAILRARFMSSKTRFAHFGSLEACVTAHGYPVAFHSDEYNVLRMSKLGRHGTETMQFDRAGRAAGPDPVRELDARTTGRVESANSTLQDRLWRSRA